MLNKSFRSLAPRLRASLAPALALLLLNSPLAALAQGRARLGDGAEAASSKLSPYVAAPSSGFIISQGEDGETVCRVATREEATSMRQGREGVELRQINHLEEGGMSSDAAGMEAVSAAGLKIILRATTQLDQQPNAATVKAAFTAAAAKWEALIQNPITVIIDVDYGTSHFGTPFPADSTILGQTGSQGLYFDNNYGDVRSRLINRAPAGSEERALVSSLPTGSLPTDQGSVNTVIVQSPNLRALGGIAANADPATETGYGEPPSIAFNSRFGFDFDPSNGITPNLTDFDAVAVHEIGHALGFDSNVGIKEIQPNEPLRPALWDLFRFRPGTAQGAFASAPRILSTGGSHVHYDGAAELPLSTGNPDGNGGDGEQASHWKDDSLNGGFFVGIMDPNVPRGRREELSNNDRRAIDYFGYQTGVLSAPPNDNFVSAQVIAGTSGTVTGTNSGATKEPGEPTNPGDTGGGRSVWYRWTAPATGNVTFDTVGSTFDTTLAVYTGGAVSALSHITSNDDIASGNTKSHVSFAAAAGTTYQIQLDGYEADLGSITLNWSQQSPPLASSVQFSASSASVSEAAGSVTVTVTRTGGTPASQSVGFFTSDGTATTFNSDYSPTSGRLDWAAGETSKTITVQIHNDTAVEPDETFNISLNLPGGDGLTIGSPASMVITVTNDDVTTSPVNAARFDFGTASIDEGAAVGRLVLNVTRAGDTSQAASVDYATSNGTASDRTDYQAAYGTLHWAAGDGSPKIIFLFVADDAYGNTGTNGQSDAQTETFNVTLSNPVGCTVGTPGQVQVTIHNNETADGANPVKGASFNPHTFVRQHYLDFFNREPDTGGLQFWMNQTTNCGDADLQVCRNNVSAAFFVSIEFQETGYLAYKMYQAAYGARPGWPVPVALDEFLPDLQQIGRGVSIGQQGSDLQLEANKRAYANEFAARPRFAALNAMTPADFINTLNANTENALTDGQRTDLVNRLAVGTITRAQALREVAENAVVSQRFFNRAFVLMQYYGYLRRNPYDAPEQNLNFDGYNFWLGKLNEFGGNYITSQMVQAFITSGEYERRFGP